MSGQGSSATFEVVATTRRRWTAEEKRSILAEAINGVSLTEVARRHGLSRELLFRWRREQREKAVLASAGPGFIPLSLPAPQSTACSSIEVVLASGARLVIGERTDLSLLKRVIAALS